MARDFKYTPYTFFQKSILITIWHNIKPYCYHFIDFCTFEISQKRKFKAAEEVKSKRPDKNVDDSRPDMKGKIGCNACCLYWALHGVSFFYQCTTKKKCTSDQIFVAI